MTTINGLTSALFRQCCQLEARIDPGCKNYVKSHLLEPVSKVPSSVSGGDGRFRNPTPAVELRHRGPLLVPLSGHLTAATRMGEAVIRSPPLVGRGVVADLHAQLGRGTAFDLSLLSRVRVDGVWEGKSGCRSLSRSSGPE